MAMIVMMIKWTSKETAQRRRKPGH